ncbi:unnamed protein product, partial [Iphiclides podalirius]
MDDAAASSAVLIYDNPPGSISPDEEPQLEASTGGSSMRQHNGAEISRGWDRLNVVCDVGPRGVGTVPPCRTVAELRVNGLRSAVPQCCQIRSIK